MVSVPIFSPVASLQVNSSMTVSALDDESGRDLELEGKWGDIRIRASPLTSWGVYISILDFMGQNL